MTRRFIGREDLAWIAALFVSFGATATALVVQASPEDPKPPAHTDAERIAYLRAHLGTLTQHAGKSAFVVDDGRTFTGTDPIALIDAAMPAPVPTTLRAVIKLGDKTYEFTEAGGKDLGDFVTPTFTQRCIKSTVPDFPMTVFFRPDRNSDRIEVVFELGRCYGPANVAAAHLGPYTAEIYRGDTLLSTVEVPYHLWFARWRYNPTPRPIVATTADLVAKKLIPGNFDPELIKYAKAPLPYTYVGPMDNAGITRGMHITGDRPDIGPITEWQASALAVANPAMTATVMAQGEAAGSIPWNIRSEVTDASPSLLDAPTLSCGDKPPSGGQPWIKRVIASLPLQPGLWTVETAHAPGLSYIPYCLTGDPYHLENLQFQANYAVMQDVSVRLKEKLQVVYPGSTRGYAWGLRFLAQACYMTPEKVPSWLQPKSYFAQLMIDNREYLLRQHVNNPSPTQSVLHAFTTHITGGKAEDYLSCWQMDFVVYVTQWIVQMGFEDWRPCADWALGNTLGRTGSQPGWKLPNACAPYLVELYEPAVGSPPPTYGTTRKLDITRPLATWDAFWSACLADPNNGILDPAPTPNALAQKFYPGYEQGTYGALCLAVTNGHAEAKPNLARARSITLDGLIRRQPPTMAAKWGWAPLASPTPTRP